MWQRWTGCFAIVVLLSACSGSSPDIDDETSASELTSVKPAFKGLADWHDRPAASNVKSWAEEVHWGDVEAKQGTFDWSKADAAVNAASLAGVRIKLRLMTGVHSPSWAKTAAGTVSLTSTYDGSVASIPRWWTGTFKTHAQAFVAAAAARYDGNATVGEVSITGTETWYPEVMLRNLSIASNRTALLAAGFDTDTKDIPAQHAMIDHAASVWKRTRVAMACNPMNRLDASGSWSGADTTTMKALIDYFRSAFGTRGVLENDSLMWPSSSRMTSTPYKTMYAYMMTKGAPIMLQTARSKVMGENGAAHQDYLDTLQYAVTLGAEAVELWNNWDVVGDPGYLTTSERRTYDGLLRAQ